MSGGADRRRAPPAVPGAPFRPPRFSRLALDNGIELLIAPRDGAALVEAHLLLRAGGEHNPLDRAGLASLTAALVDEGTRRRSGFELASRLERAGISLSATVDWDCTRLGAAFLSEQLDAALEALAEVAREPSFPDDEVARLRAQTLAEIERRPDHPPRLAGRAFAAALYFGTPFGELLQGDADGVAAIQRAEIVAFHDTCYRPGRSRLVVGGAVDVASVTAAVRRHFETWAGAPPPAPSHSVVSRRGRLVRIVDRPRAPQTELRIGHTGVPRSHPDRIRLGVLNALLGGKFSSRLNLNLRERNGFTYGVSSQFVDRREGGPFVVATSVATAVAGAAVGETLGELERLRSAPVSPSELDETVNYLLGVYPYTFQTVAGHVARLADLALHDLPDDYFDRALEQIASADADDLHRLANLHLRPAEAVIVAVGPAERLAAQLEPFGTVEILAAV